MFARVPEHVIDAMRDRLADRDVRSWEQRRFLPQLLEHLFARPILHLEANIDLGRLDALHVLIELGSASATRRGRDFGDAEHQSFERIAQRVRVGQARSGS